ncbi:MAG: lipoyl(octanoyl) transferase LipB [Betaproteobacteria bacterium]|nr:lipoyl(octanoyl) transferase LipB [Betaproteobacteria bacterium]
MSAADLQTRRIYAAQSGSLEAPTIKVVGRIDYTGCYATMRAFTKSRTSASADELWIVEHEPIYTVGLAGRPEHLPRPSPITLGSIPVTKVDRGGQITYHGPGQVIVYCLIDLARRHITVTQMVRLLEQAAIQALAAHGVHGKRRTGAPGVYVEEAKIAALGLRIRSGRCYHGIALNVTNDLTPYHAIDPCGYPGLQITRLADLGITTTAQELGEQLARGIARLLGESHGIQP